MRQVSVVGQNDYTQVSIQLEVPHNGVSLHPMEIDFPLRAKASISIPITLLAYQANLQTIEVWVSSMPAPTAGFLHQTLSLTIEHPPQNRSLQLS